MRDELEEEKESERLPIFLALVMEMAGHPCRGHLGDAGGGTALGRTRMN